MSDNKEKPSSGKLVDLSYLHELAGGSREFMVEMIEMFLEQTPGYFQQIREAIKEQNWKRVAEVAHKIKPTLAFMGIESARANIASIENKARSGQQLEEIAPAFDQLDQVSDELFASLKEAKESLMKAD